jgi:hypothetical protein
VGFEIYNKGEISEDNFELFINLWGNSGPNWFVEELKFYKEQDASWSTIQRYVKQRSVFDRLKFPPNLNTSTHVVPISSVFDRLKFPQIDSNGSNSSHAISNGSLRQSYAQAVVNPAVILPVNDPIDNGQTINLPISEQRKSGEFVSDSRGKEFCFKRRDRKLLGILPFFKFKSFASPDSAAWPDNSFHSWFRAHGPCLPPITASEFKETFSSPLFSPLPEQLAPLASQNCTVNPSSLTSPVALPPCPSAPMANIPIDPAPFVPNGFEVLQVEGQTAVQWVVLPRHARRREEYAIATIALMPAG